MKELFQTIQDKFADIFGDKFTGWLVVTISFVIGLLMGSFLMISVPDWKDYLVKPSYYDWIKNSVKEYPQLKPLVQKFAEDGITYYEYEEIQRAEAEIKAKELLN